MDNNEYSVYYLDYASAQWGHNGGGFCCLQIPVGLKHCIQNDDDSITTTGTGDYMVLIDVNGVGLYETKISPIVDESKFDTQVVYFDWIDINQYVVAEDGDEYWCGYSFGNDDYWSDLLTAAVNYYYAVTHGTGVIQF